jgi:hypothetical protein
LHEHVFCHLQLPSLQLDELRTRLRSHTHVLWLWLAIDPRTKILPVLHLGPRTQNAAHAVIHALRRVLAPDCLPLFTSDGLNLYFYALTAHFGEWLIGRRRGRIVQKTAGGGWSDLRSGEKMLPTTQARARQARDAPGNRGHSQGLLAGVRLLWTAEHRFHRAGEFDRPARNSGAGSSHLGDGTAVSAPACISRVVARLLPLCAPSRSAAGSAHAASRTRGQPSGATLPTAYSCHGSRQNHPTMDGARGARLPFVAGFRLRATEARWGAVSCHGEMGEGASRSSQMGPHSG